MGLATMKNVPISPAATVTDPFAVPPVQSDVVELHTFWAAKPAVVATMLLTPTAIRSRGAPGPVGAVGPLLVNILVIWNVRAVVPDELSTVSGTWRALGTPQPFPAVPVFAQAPPKLITTVGGCDEAKAGAWAATTITGTDQAAPRTTVRREWSDMRVPFVAIPLRKRHRHRSAECGRMTWQYASHLSLPYESFPTK